MRTEKYECLDLVDFREVALSVETKKARPNAAQYPWSATHCNTPQHTATHCNTLQHTATHCNTLQLLYCNKTTPHYPRRIASNSNSRQSPSRTKAPVYNRPTWLNRRQQLVCRFHPEIPLSPQDQWTWACSWVKQSPRVCLIDILPSQLHNSREVAVCCGVLWYVAVWCSALLCVAVRCSVSHSQKSAL